MVSQEGRVLGVPTRRRSPELKTGNSKLKTIWVWGLLAGWALVRVLLQHVDSPLLLLLLLHFPLELIELHNLFGGQHLADLGSYPLVQSDLVGLGLGQIFNAAIDLGLVVL